MLTEDQIRELKAKHGPKLYLFTTELGDVVLRVPLRQEYEKFIDETQRDGGSERGVAMTTLVRACAVYPIGAEFERIIDAQPGYIVKFSAKLQELAGNKAKLEGKEL